MPLSEIHMLGNGNMDIWRVTHPFELEKLHKLSCAFEAAEIFMDAGLPLDYACSKEAFFGASGERGVNRVLVGGF